MSGGLRHEDDDDKFVIIPRPTIRDERLSFRARGLLAFILDLPSGWDVNATWLVKQGKEGREAVYTALGELRAAGYYRIERRRAEAGRWVTGTAVSKTSRPDWAAWYAEQEAARLAKRELPDPVYDPAGENTQVETGNGFPGTGADVTASDQSDTPSDLRVSVHREADGREADGREAVDPKEERGGSTSKETPHPSGGTPKADTQLSLVDAPAEPDQKPGRRKTLLPEDWEPSPELAAWTREFAPGFPRSELDQFRDWAKGDRVLKADWDATWRNSVRRWKERTSRTRGPGRPGPYQDTGWKDGTSAASWDRLKETGGQDR